ncbi:MAG: helix-turn-helix domain-containing protein [Rubripirellula sp.]
MPPAESNHPTLLGSANTTAPGEVTDRPELISFPLERPPLRGRRRGLQVGPIALPYFLCGDENRLVGYLATADAPVFELGNPLLLVGPTGSGKTAIAMHLAARRVAATNQPMPPTVLYQTSVDFARQFAEAVASDDLPHLQQQLSEPDVLILDDLHLIADKPAAQEELALRVENRCLASQSTILTCRRLPSEVRGMRPLLISRVLPGLTIPLDLPSEQTRRQLLRELADNYQLEMSETLISELNAGLESALPCRSLEAAVKQLSLWRRMRNLPVNSESIQSAIEIVGQSQDLTPAMIAGAVAKRFRLKLSDLRSGSRKQHLVRARSLAMTLSRQMTSLSMHQIGDYFGGRDHTTVLHAIRKTESLLEHDAELRRMADDVREKLSTS